MKPVIIIPRRVAAGRVELRHFGLLDAPVLRAEIGRADFLRRQGFASPPFANVFGLWLWIRRTYSLLFVIHNEGKPVGLIGLYRLRAGKSAGLSLVLFDEENFRCGYGSVAFLLLAAIIRKSGLIPRLFVEIPPSQQDAGAFWQSMGFRESEEEASASPKLLLTCEL